ncbi:MAG: MerR family transcriptional regulator [Alphaproteobacteria bacterium]|nr:MerR family transcriptional regulator [Alphaproteobacteria bacterium]
MASPKSAEAFRTISEAASELDVPQHVLRHWEDVFGQIRPMRRAGGRRYYRPLDIDVLRGVRVLLYDERYTTRGVQKIFKENGVKYIAELGRLAAAGQPIELRPLIDNVEEDPAGDDDRAEESAVSPGSDSPGMTPALRERLTALLTQLEKVQEALDEATLAIEAIDVEAVEDQ